jgi:alpha-ketoglutarate-dependent taurine dioxygenase
LLTDNRRFMEVAPPDLLDELRSVRIAYRSLAESYYDGAGGTGQWLERAAMVRHPRTGDEMLYLALDDPEDPHRNYEAAVVGYSVNEGRRLMSRVDQILRRPDVLRAHAWQPGDFVAFDNYLVCHGRNPFARGARRRLLRVVTE